MAFRCEVWFDEKNKVGDFEFAAVPRAGDTVSLPSSKGAKFEHFKVDDVAHRAAGPELPAETFLFVSKSG